MSRPIPDPDSALTDADASGTDPVARIADYLDFFRGEVRRKTSGLDDAALQRVMVPSGWTMPGLVEHLLHMERRWIVWGFLGEDVTAPRADRDADDRWVTDRPLAQILDELDEMGCRTAAVIADHDPLEHAALGGKYGEGDPTPTLEAILFHVFQEYARHVGHLDIVRELVDGMVGED